MVWEIFIEVYINIYQKTVKVKMFYKLSLTIQMQKSKLRYYITS